MERLRKKLGNIQNIGKPSKIPKTAMSMAQGGQQLKFKRHPRMMFKDKCAIDDGRTTGDRGRSNFDFMISVDTVKQS